MGSDGRCPGIPVPVVPPVRHPWTSGLYGGGPVLPFAGSRLNCKERLPNLPLNRLTLPRAL
jgi:hypothetical protein